MGIYKYKAMENKCCIHKKIDILYKDVYMTKPW